MVFYVQTETEFSVLSQKFWNDYVHVKKKLISFDCQSLWTKYYDCWVFFFLIQSFAVAVTYTWMENDWNN
jgi:hypothetical protein